MANILLSGPPRYDARGTWPPLVALAAAVLAQAGLQLLGGVLGAYVGGSERTLVEGMAADKRLLSAISVFLALSQFGVMLFAWWAAGLFGGERRAALQLHRGLPAASEIVLALAGLVLVIGGYNLLVYLIRPDLFMADIEPFRPMLETPAWPVMAMAIGLGAPMSEELLFRGFLLSALARWRAGFWPAALVANLTWTSFHLGYSVPGLLGVFLGGLYISWLLWRSGNLWLPIIAHAVTNIVFLAIVAVYPIA